MTLSVVAHTNSRSLEQMKADVIALGDLYKAVMQVNTDYGIIPGTPKPTLLKPGAELLCLKFGYSPSFETDSSLCDFEKGFIYYRVTCKLYDASGVLVGCGMGSCNNYEPKYRYRWLWGSEVPESMNKKEMVTRSVRRNGGTIQYRINNPDPMELDNTILKMAMKRSHIAATLNATGASRIFTQDIEDMTPQHEDTEKATSQKPSQTDSGAKAGGPPAGQSGNLSSRSPAVSISNKKECLDAIGVWGFTEVDLGKYLKAKGIDKWPSAPEAWQALYLEIKAKNEPPVNA